jgi:hypothetical protein
MNEFSLDLVRLSASVGSPFLDVKIAHFHCAEEATPVWTDPNDEF